MLHGVRDSMKDENPPMLAGEIEADETFVGGKHQHLPTRMNAVGKNVPIGGPAAGKTTVFGMVQRGDGKRKSRARAMVIPNHKASSLIPRIYENVLTGSPLYTDALRSYRQTDRDFIHDFIDHSVAYVNGRVHTNTVENFWSCVKRTLHGTYIAVRPFHLNAHLDEQVFRFNGRGGNDTDRFVAALKGADGKRVTYAALTASHLSGGGCVPVVRLAPKRGAR